MERRNAIKLCFYSAVLIPTVGLSIQSCTGIYYASASRNANRLTIPKSEFTHIKNERIIERTFVLLSLENSKFPICIYKHKNDMYSASLLKCTHKSCELNVGGGIYSCPCHGSEFDTAGLVIEGPATENLTTYKTEVDHENIYVYLT